MLEKKQLRFNMHIGSQKPESIRNREAVCPFCDREGLENILAVEGSMILLRNKYNVLEETVQTVLIETDQCEAEFSTYDREHAHALIRFGVKHWREMEASGEYTSVILYKNHGPYSGGSLRHPHMQIIGLKHLDYRHQVTPSHFEGVPVRARDGVRFTVSTQPLVGFTELNVVLEDGENLEALADCIQAGAHYVMHHFYAGCNSYNLFFYDLDGRIHVKILPRFVVSPLFVGYAIPQVSNRVEEVAADIQARYFAD